MLARLLFLPLAEEVALLEHFQHDVNMGTDVQIRMVDSKAAGEGLKRRGLFYIKDASRMFLPGELQRHGLPINLAILGSRRFGLDLRKTDFDVGAMEEVAPGLYHIDGPQGFMLVPPPPASGDQSMLLSLVSRPILNRGARSLSQKRAA